MVETGRAKLRITSLGWLVFGFTLFGFLVGLGVGNWWWLRFLIVGCGVLIVDGYLSVRALRPGNVAVTISTPSDVAVGQSASLALSVEGPTAPVLVGLPGLGIWARVQGKDQGGITVTHPRRGRFTHLLTVVSHTAPLGLVGASRTMVTGLAEPLHVIPPAQSAGQLRLPRAISDDPPSTPTRGQVPELVRGAREYQPGDLVSRVHWPATARTGGKLMVREYESQISRSLVVVADLGPYAGPHAEQAARWAIWVCRQALQAGYAVSLVTVEAGSTMLGAVNTPLDVGRRLAVATTGIPDLPTSREQGQLTVAVGAGRYGRRACLWVSPRGVDF